MASKAIQGFDWCYRVLKALACLLREPGRRGGTSPMSSLELLVMPGLETLHCVSRTDDNSVRPANPAASEHKRNAPAQQNCHLSLDKVYHLTVGPFPLLS